MKYKAHSIIAIIVLVFVYSGSPTAAQGPASGKVQTPPTLDGCPIFPADNIWNTPVDTLPLDPNSDAYIANIGPAIHPHADFGSGLYEGAPIGIPFIVVPPDQPLVSITEFLYADESDPGPYPIPPDPPIEGGPDSTGDRHVLVLRQGECVLYELFKAFPNGDGSWRADSGAIFDLNSHALRPDTWTSADAAGLPILPGLARYEETAADEINHALRFTVSQTRDEHVWPARHDASSSDDPNRPPMGQRFRLKADFVIDDSFSPQGQVILRALKKYGLILADNGSNWFISGAPHESWDNDALRTDFNRVAGSDFEAVDVSSLMIDPDSGQALQATGDFTLDVTPAAQAIMPGGLATYLITVSASGNFSATVTLTATSPTADLTLDPTPTALTPPGEATLTVTHVSTNGTFLPGIVYTLPITATGGDLSRTTTVTLLVGGGRIYLPVIVKG
jgi:hypothetical protein